MIHLKRILIALAFLFLAACAGKQNVATATTRVVVGSPPTATPILPSITPTSAPAPTPMPTSTPGLPDKTDALKCIHMGSLSIDYEDLTSDQIETAVNAVKVNLPNINCIAIGLYLDYQDEIRSWIDTAHKYGFTVYLRSAGFNSWQGTNEMPADGTPDEHLQRLNEWINANYDVFENNDVFESLDEASNGAYWFATYGSSGVGSTAKSREEFNSFVRSMVTTSRSLFDAKGKSGVIVEVYHDNPSVIKDVLDNQTLGLLAWVGTNNYPPCPEPTEPVSCAHAWIEELANWRVESPVPWHITFGYTYEKDSVKQAEWFNEAIALITNPETVPNLVGITVWQFGDIGNNFSSALFDAGNDGWIPHAKSVEALNNLKLYR